MIELRVNRRACVLAALLLLVGGRVVQAQSDPRPRQALAACAAGDAAKGVAILAELYAENRDPGYVFNQGRCYQQNGRAEQALNRFREYLRRATKATPDERREVQGFIDELERQRELAAPPPAGAGDQGPRGGSLRTVGLTLAAVGVAAVGAGIVLSFKVRSSEREVERYVRETEPLADPQVVAAKMRSGGRLETFQWVAYGAGVAALAGGVTCFVLGLRADQEHRVAWSAVPVPHGVATSLRVRF